MADLMDQVHAQQPFPEPPQQNCLLRRVPGDVQVRISERMPHCPGEAILAEPSKPCAGLAGQDGHPMENQQSKEPKWTPRSGSNGVPLGGGRLMSDCSLDDGEQARRFLAAGRSARSSHPPGTARETRRQVSEWMVCGSTLSPFDLEHVCGRQPAEAVHESGAPVLRVLGWTEGKGSRTRVVPKHPLEHPDPPGDFLQGHARETIDYEHQSTLVQVVFTPPTPPRRGHEEGQRPIHIQRYVIVRRHQLVQRNKDKMHFAPDWPLPCRAKNGGPER